jgi:hypothetical protein
VANGKFTTWHRNGTNIAISPHPLNIDLSVIVIDLFLNVFKATLDTQGSFLSSPFESFVEKRIAIRDEALTWSCGFSGFW